MVRTVQYQILPLNPLSIKSKHFPPLRDRSKISYISFMSDNNQMYPSDYLNLNEEGTQ